MYGGVQTVKKLYSIGKIAHTAYTAQVAAGVPVDFAAELAVSAAKQQAALMFNPTTMAISVAMYFVMDYLMQACEQPDLEAAMMNDSGYCHYVGSYCKKEWPLIGCVQKAQSFCCFNSKLARIIHQQGRPQLTTFNSWGSAESPDCRGFKPEEFQSLDFRRINLQEYYEDLVHQTQSEMAATIQKVSTEFYEKTISE
jgi:conjugal transfer mating pair stabilization protein TraN